LVFVQLLSQPQFEQGNSIAGEHKFAQIYFQLLDSLFSSDAIAVSKRTKTKWPRVTRLLGEPLAGAVRRLDISPAVQDFLSLGSTDTTD
jgi:hypothetical protein